MTEIEVETKGGWEDHYAKSWAEVIKAGWKFCELRGNTVIMTRGGYINRFRNKEAKV